MSNKFNSLFLALRYQPQGIIFRGNVKVKNVKDVDSAIRKSLSRYNKEETGLLLSGGMDSGILASYLTGCNAYTFRDPYGLFDNEIERAKKYCNKYNLKLNYVDIDFDKMLPRLDTIMRFRGEPVHSIEPQIYLAALQAKNDGIKTMIIGDAADFVFCGFDKVFSQDWEYEAGKKRYIYVDPSDVLKDPYDIDYVFEPYRKGKMIDMARLMLDELGPEESYLSYDDAFRCAGIDYFDPYENLIRDFELDFERIKRGDSKYIIRELYKMKYPEFEIPEKIPMPRPVDIYFKDYEGPTNEVFKDFDIAQMTGNQKWLIWCLDRWLNEIHNNVRR